MFKKKKGNSKYTIQDAREGLTELLTVLSEVESELRPPQVQEVVLARRHAEDARMRLGVALAMDQGQDPWNSEVKDGK